MAETREVKGILVAWIDQRNGIKKDKRTAWYSATFEMEDGSYHKVFTGSEESLGQIMTATPEGSLVEFQERSKAGYWDIVDGSFKVVRKVEKFVKDGLSLKIMTGMNPLEVEEEYCYFAKMHDVRYSQSHILSNGQAVFYCVFIYYKGD